MVAAVDVALGVGRRPDGKQAHADQGACPTTTPLLDGAAGDRWHRPPPPTGAEALAECEEQRQDQAELEAHPTTTMRSGGCRRRTLGDCRSSGGCRGPGRRTSGGVLRGHPGGRHAACAGIWPRDVDLPAVRRDPQGAPRRGAAAALRSAQRIRPQRCIREDVDPTRIEQRPGGDVGHGVAHERGYDRLHLCAGSSRASNRVKGELAGLPEGRVDGAVGRAVGLLHDPRIRYESDVVLRSGDARAAQRHRDLHERSAGRRHAADREGGVAGSGGESRGGGENGRGEEQRRTP